MPHHKEAAMSLTSTVSPASVQTNTVVTVTQSVPRSDDTYVLSEESLIKEANRPTFLQSIKENVEELEKTVSTQDFVIDNQFREFRKILLTDIALIRNVYTKQNLARNSVEWTKVAQLESRVKQAFLPRPQTNILPTPPVHAIPVPTPPSIPVLTSTTLSRIEEISSPQQSSQKVVESNAEELTTSRAPTSTAPTPSQSQQIVVPIASEHTTTTAPDNASEHSKSKEEDSDEDVISDDVYPNDSTSLAPENSKDSSETSSNDNDEQNLHSHGSPVRSTSPHSPSEDTLNYNSSVEEKHPDSPAKPDEIALIQTDTPPPPLRVESALNNMVPQTATPAQKAPLFEYLKKYESFISKLPRMELARTVHNKTRAKRFSALWHTIERMENPDLDSLKVKSFWNQQLPAYVLICAWGVRKVSLQNNRRLERIFSAIQKLPKQQQTLLFAAFTQSRVVKHKTSASYDALRKKMWDVLTNGLVEGSSEKQALSSLDEFDRRFYDLSLSSELPKEDSCPIH
jgi:hypothetical protein